MDTSTPKYEVRDEAIEKKLREIGGSIQKSLEQFSGWTFTLLLTDTKPKGGMFYISTAERAGMVKALHEFSERNFEGMPLCKECGCASAHWEKNPDGKGYVV